MKEKAPVTVQTEVNLLDSIYYLCSNVVANFRQCVSPIVSKLSTQDTHQTLGKVS